MADVKWIKITTDIFDDEKILLIESLPDSYAIITVWFKLLCLAGKMNNSGVFMMNNRVAYTDRMLATIFRMKESTVQMALQTFESFGMIEIVDGVITIPNWNKHQSLDSYEKKKERDRLYQAERRAAQKALISESVDCQTTESSYVAVSEEDIEVDKDIYTPIVPKVDKDFDVFWKAYPKKIGKGAAKKAFKKVKVPVETLVSAIKRQERSEQWSRDNGQYIPNPSTWLNQERWEDEIGTSTTEKVDIYAGLV